MFLGFVLIASKQLPVRNRRAFLLPEWIFREEKPSFAAKGQGCGVIKTVEFYSLVEGIRKAKMEF